MAKKTTAKKTGNGKTRISRKESFDKSVAFTRHAYPNVFEAAQALAVTIDSVSPDDAKSVGIFARTAVNLSIRKRHDGASEERKLKRINRAQARKVKAAQQMANADKALAELGAGA